MRGTKVETATITLVAGTPGPLAASTATFVVNGDLDPDCTGTLTLTDCSPYHRAAPRRCGDRSGRQQLQRHPDRGDQPELRGDRERKRPRRNLGFGERLGGAVCSRSPGRRHLPHNASGDRQRHLHGESDELAEWHGRHDADGQ